jgi:hypothetical protein
MSLDLLVQACCLRQHSQIPRKKELIGAAKLIEKVGMAMPWDLFFTPSLLN